MPTERDPWLSRLPDLPSMKGQILGYMTVAKEPVEMLAMLEQFRKHGQVDDLVFEQAIAELLQFGVISHIPETVKLMIARKYGHC